MRSPIITKEIDATVDEKNADIQNIFHDKTERLKN